MMERKFELGNVVSTPGAIDAMEKNNIGATELLDRHISGDWGVMGREDKASNDQALIDGSRIMSAYSLGPDAGMKVVWIITEHDRSVTTLLLPSEY